jgi:hypothetical protein
MTAVIGILNKNGMTMAADSAVTVTGGNSKKIYNTANKIFTLSKFHPIGIMIYSSSSFMETPWEIIIKLYRKELNDTSFDRVEHYTDDFIRFMKANNYFTNDEAQLSKLKRFAYWHLGGVKERVIEEIDGEKSEDEILIDLNGFIKTDIEKTLETYRDEDEVLIDYADYTLEQFIEYSNISITEVIENVFEGAAINADIRPLINELYWKYFKSLNFFGGETGLVFGGFGEKQIYPEIKAIKVSEVIDNRIRYKADLSDEISDSNNGSILPYAQTDVINMFIKGIDPGIEETYIATIEKTLEKYNTTIADIIGANNQALSDTIRNNDNTPLIKELIDEIRNIKQKTQISPTVDTVSILSKEDLAEMAESLIYLTYLKRRISSDEESVGGPIDVAILSKGDGFVWKKRKHYFDEGLNKHFMANYFNK